MLSSWLQQWEAWTIWLGLDQLILLRSSCDSLLCVEMNGEICKGLMVDFDRFIQVEQAYVPDQHGISPANVVHPKVKCINLSHISVARQVHGQS